ncbi:MAG: ShlB/FhaC/HecB family hemolysin secretion/activation protein [Cyanobacteria bacterium P01_G01_bin.38]
MIIALLAQSFIVVPPTPVESIAIPNLLEYAPTSPRQDIFIPTENCYKPEPLPPIEILPPIAQVAEPPSAQPLPQPELTPLPPPEELLTPPATEPALPPTPDVPAEIVVERFVVEGNTVIDDDALEAVLAPYTGRPLSFAELLQARSAVTQRYVDGGFVTSGAVILPQTLTEGTVTIQMIEGQLETINVEVSGRLNAGYVRQRLRRAATPVLNTNELLDALQLLQLDPLIDSISAELSAGVQPGSSLLNVVVVEADTFDVTLQTDNGRSPSVGSFRRGATVSSGNLLGFGDQLSVGYANTDGSNTLDASYRFPLNAADGTLAANVGFTDSRVIEDPFNFLDIQSESRFYELTYRQPIIRTPEQELALSLTASRRESESEFLEDILGEALPFQTLGADENGRTRISALRFAQEWTQRGASQVFAARSQFSLGLDAFDATVSDEGSDSRFFAWRGQAQWVRLLDEDLLFLIRGDMQLATDSLVPLEQFGLGGPQTVRGYRQNTLLIDSGVLFSSEIRFPVLRIPEVDGLLQLVPFVDVGHGWNVTSPNPEKPTLASLGLGALWQMGDRFNARLDIGIPLVNISDEGNSLQESGIHFSLNYRLF